MKGIEKELTEQVVRGDFGEDAYNVERQRYQKLNIETEHLREENKNLQMQVKDWQNASPEHKHIKCQDQMRKKYYIKMYN